MPAVPVRPLTPAQNWRQQCSMKMVDALGMELWQFHAAGNTTSHPNDGIGSAADAAFREQPGIAHQLVRCSVFFIGPARRSSVQLGSPRA